MRSLAVVPASFSTLTGSVTRCPCCGAEVDKSQLLVDLKTNFCVIKGTPVHLYPKEAEILYSLHQAYPRAVSHDRLFALCYGSFNDTKGSMNSLAVIISHLRAMLRPHYVSILGRNKTYWLVLPR